MLISIQSLLDSQPYYLFDNRLRKGIDAIEESKEYNVKLRYATIRVAILDMIEGSSDTIHMPVELKEIMMSYFINNIDHYEQMIRLYTKVYSHINTEYDYKPLLNRFIRIKERLLREDGTYSLASLFHVPEKST